MATQHDTTRAFLDQQADAIERTLQRHEAPARITGGDVTPRMIHFMAQPAHQAASIRLESLSREIALALGAPTARITRQGSAVRIDVPRSDPRSVSLAHMLQRLPIGRIPSHTAVLGLADDGAPLLVRLPSLDVQHILIAGGPRTGKTALAMTIGLSLAAMTKPRDLQIVTIGADLRTLTRLPHAGALTDVWGVLALSDRRGSQDLSPHVVLLIDRLGNLKANERGAVDTLLERCALAGVHVIGVTNEQPAKPWPLMLIASKAQRAPGAFTARSFQGDIDFEAAYASADEIDDLIATIKGER